MKKKIYCFINSGRGTDWVVTSALSEDGDFLAGHCSSSDGWAKRDITCDWKHAAYDKAYPEGWELEWVDAPKEHAGIMAAYEKHLAKAPAEEQSGDSA